MNKKNIGAALSVMAAVAAGATAYASTINNLDNDKNTNSMITTYYTSGNDRKNYDYVSLVRSDYTKDLKNTSIANETRVVQNTNDKKEEVEKIEEEARKIVATTISSQTTKSNESKQEEDLEPTNTNEEATYEEDLEVVAYDSTDLSNLAVENEEEKEEAVKADEEVVVAYNATNLDKAIETSNEEDIETNESKVSEDQVVNYLSDNNKILESESNLSEKQVEASKFVNVEALNIRSSKSMDDNTNVVNTLRAGDKVSGAVDGEWLKLENGYVKLQYLANEYPQALVDSIAQKAKEAEEAKKAAEEKAKAETEAKAKALAEQKAKEEAEAKALADKKAKEEAEAKAKAEAEKKAAEEAKKQQAAPVQNEVKGQAFTGWVYNTQTLNVRDKAVNGKILGTLTKGTKVTGEISNGWVKFDYNGTVAYVSATYLTTTEVAQAPANTQVLAVEEVKDEEVVEQLAVQAAPVEAAPVANSNGQTAANIASQYVGRPYVWGSSNPQVGFDCSGLVVHSYKQLGINLPHSSKAQYNTGYAVDKSNLQPGDLVFFNYNGSIDHVGIVTSSDGTFIHASTPTTGVRYDNVFNAAYQRVYVGARRIF